MTQQWLSKELVELMLQAWETRGEMKAKIERRDAKKDVAAPKKRKWQDNDWYQESGQNPEAFCEHIIEHGCTSVSSFLLYAEIS